MSYPLTPEKLFNRFREQCTWVHTTILSNNNSHWYWYNYDTIQDGTILKLYHGMGVELDEYKNNISFGTQPFRSISLYSAFCNEEFLVHDSLENSKL